jgi:molecular chaperone GrpE
MNDRPEQSSAPVAEAANEAAQPVQQDYAARIAALESELQDMKDKWLRSEADMANLRARTKRQVQDARLYALHNFPRDVADAA